MNVQQALNRVAKWRTLFAGWQLGTRAKGDPESDAARDHREATIMLRVEVSALAAALLEARVISAPDFEKHLLDEANLLNEMYERRWPGCRATDHGLHINADAADWLRTFKP